MVFPDATIGGGAVVRGRVVVENATVGPNVTTESGEADVVVRGTVHDDVRLGGVVGSNTRLGGGTTVSPGTVIGIHARVESRTTLDGWIETDAIVRRG